MTPIEQMSQIVPALTGVVDRIWYGQLDSPTPCATFTVHDLLDHILVGAGTFAPLLRGECPADVNAPVVYGWVPAAEFAATMKDLLSAVQSPGALERVIRSPFGEVDGETLARLVAFDGLVHGWDLARATGQTWAPSPELVVAVDEFARQAITPEMRDAEMFANPTLVPVGADPLERLVAFSGRAI